MDKAIEIAKLISKDLGKNWTLVLEEYDLMRIFREVYTLSVSMEDINTVVCFIVYAYAPESFWLDLKKDRTDNKNQILINLGANIKTPFYQEVLLNKNELVNSSIFNFLENLKTWKWKFVFDLLDFSAKISKFVSEETEDEIVTDKLNKDGEVKTLKQTVDIEVITKVYKDKSSLQEMSIQKRKQADELIKEIEKDFVNTNVATQADFAFNFTESAKRRDILSWRDFIKHRNERSTSTP